jgi:hypothetical protein
VRLVEALARPSPLGLPYLLTYPLMRLHLTSLMEIEGPEMAAQKQAQRVPVTLRALAQRINRVLAKRDEQLKTTRGGRARVDLGDHYVIDVARNFVIAKGVDLETWGRELGVLQPWEEVVADEE